MNRVEEFLEIHKKLAKNGIRGTIIKYAYTGDNVKDSLYFTMSAMEIMTLFSIFRGNNERINNEIMQRNLEPVLIKIIDALKEALKNANIIEKKKEVVVDFDNDSDDEIKLI